MAMNENKIQQIQNNYVAAIAAVNQIGEALGLTRNKDLTTILQAIADLKVQNSANANLAEHCDRCIQK
jgi:hypothetical protein